MTRASVTFPLRLFVRFSTKNVILSLLVLIGQRPWGFCDSLDRTLGILFTTVGVVTRDELGDPEKVALLRQTRVTPACARSEFWAGLYPLAAVRCTVAERLAGPAGVVF